MNIQTFGTIISANRSPNEELSIEQRTAILALRTIGKSLSKIVGVMGCARQTITRTIRRFIERNNVTSRPRSGYP